MKFVFADFETYYDKTYTLKKMTPAEYILDQRFEAIMLNVIEDMEPPRIIDGPDIPAYLATLDPLDTATVTFNALFDNAILAWRYNFVPAQMFDCMNMVRALHGYELRRFSLEAVAQHFGLPPKLKTIDKVIGLHRDKIKERGLWDEMCQYCEDDNKKCATIFWKLIPEFPITEWKVMDLVIRATVEPKFQADDDLLQQHYDHIIVEKQRLLDEAQAEKKELMSAAKFTLRLQELGVMVEYKTSSTGRLIPAFAKTDKFMTDLLEHDDPRVQVLAMARLGHKSTIMETRVKRYLDISRLPWPNYCRGNIPMPLRYGAAHTHRLGGDWKMNPQNLPK